MKRDMALCFVTLLVFSVVGSGLARGALPEGLVFLMIFDEGTGDIVHDQSGFGNDGTVEGNTEWEAGKYGNAFNFDGTTHITVPNAEPLSELTHPMSAGLWINPTAVGGWRSILEMDGPTGWKIGTHDGSDAIVWTTYFVKDFVAVTPVPVGEWTHIAATWDGSEVLIYFNGELDAAVAGGGVIDVSVEPSLDIGYRSSSASSYYEGAVDEVFIFDRIISKGELNTYMSGFDDFLAVEPGGKLAAAWGALKDPR